MNWPKLNIQCSLKVFCVLLCKCQYSTAKDTFVAKFRGISLLWSWKLNGNLPFHPQDALFPKLSIKRRVLSEKRISRESIKNENNVQFRSSKSMLHYGHFYLLFLKYRQSLVMSIIGSKIDLKLHIEKRILMLKIKLLVIAGLNHTGILKKAMKKTVLTKSVSLKC